MTKEEQIKKIFKEAQEQVLAVLFNDDKHIAQAASNIDFTADKIMRDAFATKTMLIDENNIDVGRYEMLEFLPDEDIIELFESCKKWSISNEDDGKYSRFCHNMAKMRGTTLEQEKAENINSIIFKYKQLNVNNTGFTNGETQT